MSESFIREDKYFEEVDTFIRNTIKEVKEKYPKEFKAIYSELNPKKYEKYLQQKKEGLYFL